MKTLDEQFVISVCALFDHSKCRDIMLHFVCYSNDVINVNMFKMKSLKVSEIIKETCITMQATLSEHFLVQYSMDKEYLTTLYQTIVWVFTQLG